MLTLRCTRKLQQALRQRVSSPPVASTTALGDWYGDLFGARHRRFAIFMSEHSLLPVILEQRDLHDLLTALRTACTELLPRIGVPMQLLEAELDEMDDLRLGPTRSRSVLGSMNDMKQSAHWLLTTGEPTLLGVEMHLSETPCGPLGYRSPREVTLGLLRAHAHAGEDGSKEKREVLRPRDSNRHWLLEQSRRASRGYPTATVAYYGPNDKQATKVAVAIVTEKEDVAFLERWFSEDIDTREDPSINRQVVEFIRGHGARTVVVADRIIGCPHEEGIDYPEGAKCPRCPFWADKDRWTGERLH